jgi:hypothetical protein
MSARLPPLTPDIRRSFQPSSIRQTRTDIGHLKQLDRYEVVCETNYIQITKVFFPLTQYPDNTLSLDELNNILYWFLKSLITDVFKKDYYINILLNDSFNVIKENIKRMSELIDRQDSRTIINIDKIYEMLYFINQFVRAKQILQIFDDIDLSDHTHVHSFIDFVDFFIANKDLITDCLQSSFINDILRDYNTLLQNHGDLDFDTKHQLRVNIEQLKHVLLFLEQIQKFLNDYLPKIKEIFIVNNQSVLKLYKSLTDKKKTYETQKTIMQLKEAGVVMESTLSTIQLDTENEYAHISREIKANRNMHGVISEFGMNYVPRHELTRDLYDTITIAERVHRRVYQLTGDTRNRAKQLSESAGS